MSPKEAHILALSQVGDLLHAMGYPERELALFIMLAEMSVAEICGLQWKYLNLSNTSRILDYEVIPPLMIAVREQLYRGELTTAVGNRRRFVRVTPSLCSLLREMRNRGRFTLPNDFVFVSRKGTAIHPENVAARRLKSLGKSFGMAWLSWPVFHRTGIKLKRELGRAFDVEFEKIVAALRSAPS
jgi:integrase